MSRRLTVSGFILYMCTSFLVVPSDDHLVTNMTCVMTGPITDIHSSQCACKLEIGNVAVNFNATIEFDFSAILTNIWIAEVMYSEDDRIWFVEGLHTIKPPMAIHLLFQISHNSTEPPHGQCKWTTDPPLLPSEQTSQTTIPPSTDKNSPAPTTTPIVTTTTATSTTATTSAVTAIPNVNNSSCLCPCACGSSSNNTDAKLQQIISDLIIPKNSTSFAKRKLTSADDARMSSRSIGCMGIAVLCSVFGTIVLCDLGTVIYQVRSALYTMGHTAVGDYSNTRRSPNRSHRQTRIGRVR